jgi:hypothetical protein
MDALESRNGYLLIDPPPMSPAPLRMNSYTRGYGVKVQLPDRVGVGEPDSSAPMKLGRVFPPIGDQNLPATKALLQSLTVNS